MPTVLGLQHPLGVQTGTEQSGALGNNRSAFSKCWRGTYCGSVFTRNPFPTPSPTTSPVQHRLCPCPVLSIRGAAMHDCTAEALGCRLGCRLGCSMSTGANSAQWAGLSPPGKNGVQSMGRAGERLCTNDRLPYSGRPGREPRLTSGPCLLPRGNVACATLRGSQICRAHLRLQAGESLFQFKHLKGG